jgi:uncharacterized protein
MASIKPRLTLVTLGVSDLPRAKTFYECLGWVASGAGNEHVTFFHSTTAVLGLFGRAALAEDAHVADTPTGFAAVTLGWNCTARAEVDTVFAAALKAGATSRKVPQEVFWGGYSGYFADPDGHLWEVAHNPFFPFDEDGRLVLPGIDP